MSKAFLILKDGSIFEGQSIGMEGMTIGETVFTTGMTGYIETLTDPSYFGQIVTQTFPLIGNYGLERADFESKKSYVKGYIVRELCEKDSNFRSEGNLDSFLKEQGIVGICGIDTRSLTKKIRESGVMNGMILSGEKNISLLEKSRKKLLKDIADYKITRAVESVQSSNEEYSLNEKGKYSVCLLDFGSKANIERELEKRDCKVTILPYNTSAEKIISLQPDGIMLSNGPGDPADNVSVISEIKKLCEYGKIPIFGICLGHQMLALANGAQTSRLKYGHRGGNHPVKDLKSGRIYITSQNHGYAVESATLPDFIRETFVNLNDGTCEGLEYTDINAFSVQFHPEACGGPKDTNFLFDRFIEMIKNNIYKKL